MTISGIIKSTFIDFPGVISCVLFVPGCDYDCFYCHNRRLLDGTHEKLDPEYIKKFLVKRKGMLEGVVVSGGEPTLWPDLIPYIKWLKSLGYKVKLDSNGSNPEVISKLLSENICDYFAIDYKAPSSRYPEICGVNADGETVRKTIGLLDKAGVPFEVRTTVIPQLSEEDLVKMARELPLLPKYVLNKYRVPGIYRPEDRERVMEKAYTAAKIKEFAEKIRVFQPNVSA